MYFFLPTVDLKDNIFWWFKTHAFAMEHLSTSIIIASNEGCTIGKNDDVLRTTITCPFKYTPAMEVSNVFKRIYDPRQKMSSDII